jgi:hypothetical protein
LREALDEKNKLKNESWRIWWGAIFKNATNL